MNRAITTLSGYQLKKLLDYIAPDETEDQLESELTLVEKDSFTSTDNEEMPAGLYAFITDYPEEGLYGPINSNHFTG